MSVLMVRIGIKLLIPYQTQALLGKNNLRFLYNTAAFGYRPNSIGNPEFEMGKFWPTFNTGVRLPLFGKVESWVLWNITLQILQIY